MLVVVTIIALFVGAGAAEDVQACRRGAQSRRRARRSTAFMTALGAYKLDTSMFPTTEQGLRRCVSRPPDVPLWNGPYLPQDVPMDPWGHPYVYKFPGEHGDEPDIVSLGADGSPGGEEINADILSWKNQ